MASMEPVESEIFAQRRRPKVDLLAEPTETEIEIIREQAAALCRAGIKVEECLLELKELEGEIERLLSEGKKEEAEKAIHRFNELCDRAELYLYYLVIQREAVGFRRHPDMAKIYPIPRKKRPLRDEALEDRHP